MGLLFVSSLSLVSLIEGLLKDEKHFGVKERQLCSAPMPL